MREDFSIAGVNVSSGATATLDIPISRLSTHTPMSLPVRVLHGRKPGPVMFVSAGIHGDEIIGIEIIRRVLQKVSPKNLSGTLLCVPIVNVFGFVTHSRYLPDRRDLNRTFPGTANGSLAAQLAHVFRSEIIERSTCGIDIHSAGLHRENLPQIRISNDNPKLEAMALDFRPPVIIKAPLRDGSLRGTARDLGVDVLLYEAGEALRFDETAIRIGLKGIFGVMAGLGMVPGKQGKMPKLPPVHTDATHWLRAPKGGLFRALKANGASVTKGELLGMVADPFGDNEMEVLSKYDGIIIGRTNLPVVNQGDALMHIAEVKRLETAESRIEDIHEQLVADPLFDEDEII